MRAKNIDPRKAVDLPWIGETFTLRSKTYSVVDINHPANPKGAHISAYRDYGRFGMIPTTKIKNGESCTFNYRFLVAEGEMLSAETIQASRNAFTGRSDVAPSVTVKSGEKWP